MFTYDEWKSLTWKNTVVNNVKVTDQLLKSRILELSLVSLVITN